jgi:gamma-D-glutamyl-L-lysine dipeptidyl-peptidase
MSEEARREAGGDARRATVAHNVVHMHAKPSRDSERVSQTLAGRSVLVLQEEEAWAYVEDADTYRGWVEKRWLAAPTSLALTPISAVFADLRAEPRENAPLLLRLSILTGVHVEKMQGNWAYVTLPDCSLDGWMRSFALTELPKVPAEGIATEACRWSREFLGTPYLWGGSSSFGLDCSGFVQMCYRLAGLTLRRDADIQRSDTRFVPVAPEERVPGDLVFFGKPDKITHVGMQFEGDTFIHAAGGAGVIVTEWGDSRYSPGYVDARRLDPARAADPILRHEADDR